MVTRRCNTNLIALYSTQCLVNYLLTTNRPARAHHFLLARPLSRSKPNQIYIPRTNLPLTYFIHLPMKMEPIVSSEKSAIRTQTPGNYPKRNKLHLYAFIFALCPRYTGTSEVRVSRICKQIPCCQGQILLEAAIL